jgi:hypothetical protein
MERPFQYEEKYIYYKAEMLLIAEERPITLYERYTLQLWANSKYFWSQFLTYSLQTNRLWRILTMVYAVQNCKVQWLRLALSNGPN